jgi:signal transduction histidine kinase
LIFTVLDNAVGVPTSTSASGRFGPRGLNERTEVLGGRLGVSSRSPSGTTLTPGA